jgi:L-glyceraldehyde 3-phosphate reductase
MLILRTPMPYVPSDERYGRMIYRRCGRSGIHLPAISLGLWHNFGSDDSFERSRAMLRRALDLGITHFDLANNYGPPYGSAEETFGRAMKLDLAPFRDELLISTKAGYDMWPGPYGNWGSRKYLLASLDQSLKRMGLDYVDIFYHHRPDPETPLEETMGALGQAVRSGKALYAGISNYPPERTAAAAAFLRRERTPFLIHQFRYSIFRREPEAGLLNTLSAEGLGGIAFSPLAQGLLSDRYLSGIPADSRVGRGSRFLQPNDLDAQRLAQIRALHRIAEKRGQSLARMALAWVLREPAVTSVLVGASTPEQLAANVEALQNLEFTADELAQIAAIASPDPAVVTAGQITD